MNKTERSATLVPAVGAQVERGVGRLVPERAETALGVHWLGGVPYMLTSTPTLTPEQRARLISGGPNAGRVRREGK
jgi:hypothetical protein